MTLVRLLKEAEADSVMAWLFGCSVCSEAGEGAARNILVLGGGAATVGGRCPSAVCTVDGGGVACLLLLPPTPCSQSRDARNLLWDYAVMLHPSQ